MFSPDFKPEIISWFRRRLVYVAIKGNLQLKWKNTMSCKPKCLTTYKHCQNSYSYCCLKNLQPVAVWCSLWGCDWPFISYLAQKPPYTSLVRILPLSRIFPFKATGEGSLSSWFFVISGEVRSSLPKMVCTWTRWRWTCLTQIAC